MGAVRSHNAAAQLLELTRRVRNSRRPVDTEFSVKVDSVLGDPFGRTMACICRARVRNDRKLVFLRGLVLSTAGRRFLASVLTARKLTP
jgi:hypothetical protein